MSFQDLMNQPLPSATKVEENANNEFDADAVLQEIEESAEFNAEELLEEIVESVSGDEDETPAENPAEEPTEDTVEESTEFNAEAVLQEIEESVDGGEGEETENPDGATDEGCCSEDGDEEDVIATEPDVDDLDDEDFDVDDLSDEELAAIDAELSDDTLDDISDDGEDEEELTPEEEIEADDMMKVAATTMLVNDELNTEEKVALLSNEAELASIINEGFMTESDINGLAYEAGLVTEAKYTNKMIIRLDAASKKKQLYALAVNVSAAAHNDRDYQKLKKVMKMRKILRARLNKKYKTEATKRMKIYFKRLRNSKSNTLAGIAKKRDK